MLFELFDAALCIGYASDSVQYVKKEIAEGQAIKEDKRRDAMPKFEEYLPWVNPCAPKEPTMMHPVAPVVAKPVLAVDVASSMANIC